MKPYASEKMLRIEPHDVGLNNVAKQGSWFALNDGPPAQVKTIRVIGGEHVIFAHIGSDDDRRRLKR